MPQDSVSSTAGCAPSSADCDNRLSDASLSSVKRNCFLCISESISSDLSVDEQSHPELSDILYSNESDSPCEIHRIASVAINVPVGKNSDSATSVNNMDSSLPCDHYCELETVHELDCKEIETNCMERITENSDSLSVPKQEIPFKLDCSMKSIKSNRHETNESEDCGTGSSKKEEPILIDNKEDEHYLQHVSKKVDNEEDKHYLQHVSKKVDNEEDKHYLQHVSKKETDSGNDNTSSSVKQENIPTENDESNQNQPPASTQELNYGKAINSTNFSAESLGEGLLHDAKITCLNCTTSKSWCSSTSAKEEDITGDESGSQIIISSCWDSLHNEDAKDKDQVLEPDKSTDDIDDNSSDDSGWDSECSDYYTVEKEEVRLKHQKRRVKRIQTVLDAATLDLGALKELAARRNGYIKDALRRRVWPMLLQVQDTDTIPLLSEEEAAKYHSYNQVVMDVKRALKRFPPNLTDNVRDQLIDQVILVIMTVLQRHPQMHYYQGYHDVAVTFIMVCGEQRAVMLLEAVSLTHLREYLQPTMERTMRCQTFLYPILRSTRPLLYQHMMQCGVGTVFCLAWVITWYAHSVPDYSDVVRLYDFLLASPPLMPVYLAAAILAHRHLQLLDVECDMAMMHFALSQVTSDSDLPLDAMVRQAKLLYETHPPSAIEDEVDELLLQQKQQAEAEREERLRLRAAHDRRRNQPPAAPVWWLTRAVGAAVHGVVGQHGVYSMRGASTAVAVLAVMVGFTALYYKNYSGGYRLLQLPW